MILNEFEDLNLIIIYDKVINLKNKICEIWISKFLIF